MSSFVICQQLSPFFSLKQFSMLCCSQKRIKTYTNNLQPKNYQSFTLNCSLLLLLLKNQDCCGRKYFRDVTGTARSQSKKKRAAS
jgi:hypothetical protein